MQQSHVVESIDMQHKATENVFLKGQCFCSICSSCMQAGAERSVCALPVTKQHNIMYKYHLQCVGNVYLLV